MEELNDVITAFTEAIAFFTMDIKWTKAFILEKTIINNTFLLQEQDPIFVNKEESISEKGQVKINK